MGVETIWEQLAVRYPVLQGCREDILSAFQLMKTCFEGGGKLLVCGNGGSGADAQHIVGELMKDFSCRRRVAAEFEEECRRLYPGEGLEKKVQAALPAIALGVNQVLASACANDIGREMVYAQEVFGYGRKGDALLALSTSGNSENVLNAVKIAEAVGMETIGIGGRNGGMLRGLCGIYVELPEDETYLVQELVLPVCHAWCRMLETAFW